MPDKQELANVQLKVRKSLYSYPGSTRDYTVVLFGPVSQHNLLCNEQPRRCIASVFDEWIKDLWVPKNATIFFQFGVMEAETSAIIDQERIEAHSVYIGAHSVNIECEYNRQDVVTVEVYNSILGGHINGTLTNLSDLPLLPETLKDLKNEHTPSINKQDKTKSTDLQNSKKNSKADGSFDAPDDSSSNVRGILATVTKKGRSFLKGAYKHAVPVGLAVVACSVALYSYTRLKK